MVETVIGEVFVLSQVIFCLAAVVYTLLADWRSKQLHKALIEDSLNWTRFEQLPSEESQKIFNDQVSCWINHIRSV